VTGAIPSGKITSAGASSGRFNDVPRSKLFTDVIIPQSRNAVVEIMEEHKMSRHGGSITIVLAAMVFSFVFADMACAQMSCSDLRRGKPDYHEKMDELAEMAQLPDSYWSRYHEALVNDLCSGDIKDVDKLVDNGFVNPGEAQSIARVLGKQYKPKVRSETGKTYGDSRAKFLGMGACSACADNIAQYYTNKPESPCGKLAQMALDGDPGAIKKLIDFPDYCQWSYSNNR